MSFHLTGQTQFCVAIRHPISGRIVTAETLYNDACRGIGHVITDHIADLVYDNLVYPIGGLGAARGDQVDREIRAWAEDVYAKLRMHRAREWVEQDPTECMDTETYLAHVTREG